MNVFSHSDLGVSINFQNFFPALFIISRNRFLAVFQTRKHFYCGKQLFWTEPKDVGIYIEISDLENFNGYSSILNDSITSQSVTPNFDKWNGLYVKTNSGNFPINWSRPGKFPSSSAAIKK